MAEQQHSIGSEDDDPLGIPGVHDEAFFDQEEHESINTESILEEGEEEYEERELDEGEEGEDEGEEDDSTPKLTLDMVQQIKQKLGVITLCWPEIKEPGFEGRTNFPESYYTNNDKERLCLLYAENFRRQFTNLYKTRRPILLACENECGIQVSVNLVFSKDFTPFIKHNLTGEPPNTTCRARFTYYGRHEQLPCTLYFIVIYIVCCLLNCHALIRQ